MSDVREAFEAHYREQHGGLHPVTDEMFDMRHDYYIDGAVDDEWQAFKAGHKAALQSQTAPAVPDDHYPDVGMMAFQDVEGKIPAKPGDPVGLAIMPDPFADHSPDAGKVVHWAIKNPGNADQRRCESRAVRKALGFAPDADDVSPCDLVDAIAEIKNAPAADGGEVEYSQGVCEDGAAILKNGQPMTIEEILTGLRQSHPAQPRNEEIAADFEAWLSQVRHMEGLSAHDIVESAEIYIAQLRASQQEGGDDSE